MMKNNVYVKEGDQIIKIQSKNDNIYNQSIKQIFGVNYVATQGEIPDQCFYDKDDYKEIYDNKNLSIYSAKELFYIKEGLDFSKPFTIFICKSYTEGSPYSITLNHNSDYGSDFDCTYTLYDSESMKMKTAITGKIEVNEETNLSKLLHFVKNYDYDVITKFVEEGFDLEKICNFFSTSNFDNLNKYYAKRGFKPSLKIYNIFCKFFEINPGHYGKLFDYSDCGYSRLIGFKGIDYSDKLRYLSDAEIRDTVTIFNILKLNKEEFMCNLIQTFKDKPSVIRTPLVTFANELDNDFVYRFKYIDDMEYEAYDLLLSNYTSSFFYKNKEIREKLLNHKDKDISKHVINDFCDIIPRGKDDLMMIIPSDLYDQLNPTLKALYNMISYSPGNSIKILSTLEGEDQIKVKEIIALHLFSSFFSGKRTLEIIRNTELVFEEIDVKGIYDHILIKIELIDDKLYSMLFDDLTGGRFKRTILEDSIFTSYFYENFRNSKRYKKHNLTKSLEK